jgi:hypothetical protein
MDLRSVVVADELHYRRLLHDIRELVGVAEAARLTVGKTIPELVLLKERLLRDLMGPGRAAA